MKYDENEEVFFKKLASLYVEKDGDDLKKEVTKLDIESKFEYPNSLDKKIKTKISKIKTRNSIYKILPIVASLIIAMIIFRNNFNDTNIKKQDMKFLSAKLPQGYELTNMEYDNEKKIYYITNHTKNNIVLVTEEFDLEIEKELFKEININNNKGYLLSKTDFNILQYKKDKTLYTITSQYDYEDLIELSKNLI